MLEMEMDNKQIQNKLIIQRQRVIAENTHGEETKCGQGWSDLEPSWVTWSSLESWFTYTSPRSNTSVAQTEEELLLSLIARAGFMARLLKDNQAPRRLPPRGSAFLDTALLQSGLPGRPHRRLQEAGSKEEGHVPPLQETPGSCSHPLPPSPLATPACQGTGKWQLYPGARPGIQLKLRHFITSS